jgi:hypothetical protein
MKRKNEEFDEMKFYIAIGFILIVAGILMSMCIYFAIMATEKPKTASVSIQNVAPPKEITIKDQKIKLDGIEGFEIDIYDIAGQDHDLYVMRTLGRVYEIPFNSRSDAEDAGNYICIVKGDRL